MHVKGRKFNRSVFMVRLLVICAELVKNTHLEKKCALSIVLFLLIVQLLAQLGSVEGLYAYMNGATQLIILV